MKKLVLILTFTLGFNAFASIDKASEIYKKPQSLKRDRELSIELFKSKYFFSALAFAKNYIAGVKELDPEFEAVIAKLMIKTGTMSFSYMDRKILKRHLKSPTLALAYGIRMSQLKKWNESNKALSNVPADHRFGPEARMLQGAALNMLMKDNEAVEMYKQCIKVSKKIEDDAAKEKLGRYYAIIKESCFIHLGRIEYRNGNYEEAKLLYRSIPKTSYRFPYILMEKAWNAYQREDYNRSLGVLVTYKNPLMSSYFFPESEVLRALSYFKLCLWEDSMVTIENYYKRYKTKSDALKSILMKHKRSHTYFLKLIFAPIEETEKLHPYVRNMMTQIRKKIKFSIDLVSYKKAQNELKFIKKLPTSKLKYLMEGELKETLKWRTTHLNHYIKKQMFDFVNQIHRFSYEMFNIKLEILARKRDLVWENKQLISSRSRGSHENLKRESDEHFYDFRGEFWADELGDYSFGLKSNCEKVRVGVAK
ncbi:MAG: hypothetical protein KC493_14645 [Bacteriovoracaceae bacterium]|nr:hypothetical protein [Bacteriovoracaceae bacterium]